MIISRTPFRISFSGGGTDLPAFYSKEYGAVLSFTLQKYIYSVIYPRFEKNHRISHSSTEISNQVGNINHDIVREALRMTQTKEFLDIATFSDIPPGTGMGSSSALTVGLLNALYQLGGKKRTPEILAAQACQLEIDHIGGKIGKQDQYAAAYGGFNYIRFNPDGSVIVAPVPIQESTLQELESMMLLVFTGTTRSASELLKKQSQETDKKRRILRQMRNFAIDMTSCISGKGDIKEFSKILHESWLLKSSLGLGISNPHIVEMYEKGRANGALGGKLLGAGGGGFILFLAPPECHEKILEAVGSPTSLDVKIDHKGSQIILDNSESLSQKKSHRLLGPKKISRPKTKALILAGGKGSRLKPITDTIPKCLVDLKNRPLLEYWINNLAQCGIKNILINTSYLRETVKSYIDKINDRKSIQIVESHEKELLGSAGTVTNNSNYADDCDDVIVIYADNFSSVNLEEVLKFHRTHTDPMTMVLFRSPKPESCGIVKLDENSLVVNYVEKPENPESNLANAGIYVLRKEAYQEIAKMNGFDFGFDILPKFIGRARGAVLKGYHLDVGTPETYQKAINASTMVLRDMGYNSDGSRKAVFLDRDGVLIDAVPYISDPNKVTLKKDAVEAMKFFRSQGYALIVVTNQSGIGRGLISQEEYEAVTNKMLDLYEKEEIVFDSIQHCPEKPQTKDRTIVESFFRKPGPGMIIKAANELNINLSDSIMIGDMISDVLSGYHAKCKHSYLISDSNEYDSSKSKFNFTRVNSFQEIIFDFEERKILKIS